MILKNENVLDIILPVAELKLKDNLDLKLLVVENVLNRSISLWHPSSLKVTNPQFVLQFHKQGSLTSLIHSEIKVTLVHFF